MPPAPRLAPLAFLFMTLGACAPAASPAAGSAAGPAASPAAAKGAPAGAPAATSPADAAGEGAASQAAAPRRARLRFDLDGRSFPSPLADAIVGGQPTTLLIDTGATHHVVARWLADELSIPQTSGGDVGLDHAGQAVRITRIEGAPLSLSGWGRVDAPLLLVVAIPEALQHAGIGGVLSPQALAAGGRAVILNLREGLMSDARLEDALLALAGSPEYGELIELALCGGENEGRQIIAPAHVNGVEVHLKVDSGATQTSIFAGTPAGKRLAAGARGARSAYAASGKHTVPVLAGTRLALGSGEVVTDIDVLPNAPRPTCPADGFVGMDALRQCILVLGESRAAARCRRPG